MTLFPDLNTWIKQQRQCVLWWLLSDDSSKVQKWEPRLPVTLEAGVIRKGGSRLSR